MKKWLALAVACAAVMMLSAFALAEEPHEHYAFCNAKTVCAVCGEAYSGSDIRHKQLSDIESLNTTLHIQKCGSCGEQWITPHEERCSKPGECYDCGTAMGLDLMKHVHTHWEHDEKAHWSQCDDCGEIVGARIEHFAFCSKPGVCYECEMPYTGEKFSHAGPTHYESDESSHRKVCDACGETLEGPEGHALDCRAPAMKKCFFCGEPYSGNNRYHTAWLPVRTDPDAHWNECVYCGTKVTAPEKHNVTCSSPDACTECGAPANIINNLEVLHPYVGYKYDVAGHWQECVCGEAKSALEPHDISLSMPGVCTICGGVFDDETSDEYENGRNVNNRFGKLAWFADGELVDYTGLHSFEGALFYFEHGIVRDDLMGPVQINNIWYAFDQGRVMMQEMLVPYDGGVFAFKNGTIDTTQHGLVEFNGQKFVFSLGQYQPDVYGAWHDPITGDWVYVWEGQYYETTDLVRYDGEIFYFVNGKLALDFTGTVKDFQGAEFNVVNGQVTH